MVDKKPVGQKLKKVVGEILGNASKNFDSKRMAAKSIRDPKERKAALAKLDNKTSGRNTNTAGVKKIREVGKISPKKSGRISKSKELVVPPKRKPTAKAKTVAALRNKSATLNPKRKPTQSKSSNRKQTASVGAKVSRKDTKAKPPAKSKSSVFQSKKSDFEKKLEKRKNKR